MEPAWMQKISSSTICAWFYTFFVVYAVILTIVILGVLYALVSMRKDVTVSNLFFAFIQMLVATTNMMFFYIMCDRALHPQ
jgi:hypothetical protein